MKEKHNSLQQPDTGSSLDGEPVFVIVGKLRKPHGIRGEIRMTVLTDTPELIAPGVILYIGESYQPFKIKSTRWHGADLLVTFEELPDRTAVEIFRNIMVYMKGEDVPRLEEGEFYLHQLIGLQVVSDDKQQLGRIKEVLLTGANDVYLVQSSTGGKDLLIPATDEVVLDINWDEGFMLVHILPGLLDL